MSSFQRHPSFSIPRMRLSKSYSYTTHHSSDANKQCLNILKTSHSIMQQQINDLVVQLQTLQQTCEEQQQTINILTSKCDSLESCKTDKYNHVSVSIPVQETSTQTNETNDDDGTVELQHCVVTMEELSAYKSVEEP